MSRVLGKIIIKKIFVKSLDKLRGKWYNRKFGAPQSSARRRNLSIPFLKFVQNDENPNPKWIGIFIKKERGKGVENSGMGLISATPEKPYQQMV